MIHKLILTYERNLIHFLVLSLYVFVEKFYLNRALILREAQFFYFVGLVYDRPYKQVINW